MIENIYFTVLFIGINNDHHLLIQFIPCNSASWWNTEVILKIVRVLVLNILSQRI